LLQNALINNDFLILQYNFFITVMLYLLC